jgi:hypothetical protein
MPTHFKQYFYVCGDGFQGLSKDSHYPIQLLTFLLGTGIPNFRSKFFDFDFFQKETKKVKKPSAHVQKVPVPIYHYENLQEKYSSGDTIPLS